MLSINDDCTRLTWGESDIIRMATLVGPDDAVKRKIPYYAPILRAYMRNKQWRRFVSDKAKIQYDAECLVRTQRQLIEAQPPQPKHADETRGWKHQQRAVHTFRHAPQTGWLVGDDVGVGKTWQALMWARHVARSRRTLIVTKNIAKEQWRDAIKYWLTPGKNKIAYVDGTKTEQLRVLQRERVWTVAHWESLSLLPDAYKAVKWGAIILDEVHLICNRDTIRSGVAAHLRGVHRMGCTAHPFTNDPGEVWAILRFLYPTIYKSYWRFFHLHVDATPKQWGGFDVEGAKRPKLLQWELQPFLMRRMRTEVFPTLPRFTRTPRRAHLTRQGQKDYDNLRKRLFAALKGFKGQTITLPIINDFVRLTRTRQYLIDPGLVGGSLPSLKYPIILELLQDIRRPVVIFSEFAQALQRLHAYLKKHARKIKVAHIHGGMKKNAVPTIKKKFIRGDIDALCCVGASADTALNLAGHGFLIHLDLPFNPRQLEQREGRVDRPQEFTGTLVPSTGYHVTVEHTYEDRLMSKLERKHKSFGTVFTPHEIEELFA